MSGETRRLGRSALRGSALGMGTNPLGGPMWDLSVRQDGPVGYGVVSRADARAAIHAALDAGITFFDTADEYGCGRAERLLGEALQRRRREVVIATKFGHTFDEVTRHVTGTCATPEYVRQACEASLRRLQTDVIDLYLLHLRDLPLAEAAAVRDSLEALVAAGKIRFYGWSTDDVERARFFAGGPHCTAIEHRLNLFIDAPEMLALCNEADLASINRIPLLMGILTGRYRGQNPQLPPGDIRSVWFAGERARQDAARLEKLRGILTTGGRTVAQGALAWIWARHPRTIPIPGCRTAAQAAENGAALGQGPLTSAQMAAIDALLTAETGGH